MKGAALAVMLTLVGAFALTQPAHAVVCAKGVYRAGCAGPSGAAVVRRPYGYHGGAAVVRGPNGAAVREVSIIRAELMKRLVPGSYRVLFCARISFGVIGYLANPFQLVINFGLLAATQ